MILSVTLWELKNALPPYTAVVCNKQRKFSRLEDILCLYLHFSWKDILHCVQFFQASLNKVPFKM